MTRPVLLFLHGWGFDASLWHGICAALPEFDTRCDDRGYFAEPRQYAGTPTLAVGHSLGAMLLAQHLPPVVPLVAINGFDRFCGKDAVSPRLLDRMRRRFAEDPAQVLADFRARCGESQTPAIVAAERLAADLELLATMNAEGNTRRIWVLHGAQDPLLPDTMRARVFSGSPRLEHRDGGHLLPHSHADWCAGQIRSIWRQICP